MNESSKNCHLFISWSGDRSHELAKWLHKWFHQLTPSVNVYFSADIMPGVSWIDHVRDQMSKANAAVFCVTPDNVDSRWINYELGLVVGASDARFALILLLDIDPSDLPSPLSHYQASTFSKETIISLFRVASDVKTNTDDLIDAQWPQMYEEAKAFLIVDRND